MKTEDFIKMNSVKLNERDNVEIVNMIEDEQSRKIARDRAGRG